MRDRVLVHLGATQGEIGKAGFKAEAQPDGSLFEAWRDGSCIPVAASYPPASQRAQWQSSDIRSPSDTMERHNVLTSRGEAIMTREV